MNRTFARRDKSRDRGPPRYSGQQREVLCLYRDCLREALRLEDSASSRNLHAFIQSKFREGRDIPRKEVTRVEWQMHYGRTKLDELRALRADAKFHLVGAHRPPTTGIRK